MKTQHIKDTINKLGEVYHIHISASPKYFCNTLLGWQFNVISFNESIKSEMNMLEKYNTKEEALRAGVNHVFEILGL